MAWDEVDGVVSNLLTIVAINTMLVILYYKHLLGVKRRWSPFHWYEICNPLKEKVGIKRKPAENRPERKKKKKKGKKEKKRGSTG